MRVAYSRISTAEQDDHGALETMRRQLEATGADEILLEIGSGKDDSERPQFRKLVEQVKQGLVTEILVPSQDRLYRNLGELMKFVETCRVYRVKVSDLNGRDLTCSTADGTLWTQLLGSLDQHRSGLYGEKTRKALEAARSMGFPARPRIPFGLRKVRDANGRFIAVELDPELSPLARARVDAFLKQGLGLTGVAKWIQRNQPEAYWVQQAQLRRWLVNPMLTGRLCWHKADQLGNFHHVDSEQTFPALVTDAEMEIIKSRVNDRTLTQGVKDQTRRMLSGIARCASCNGVLSHKVNAGRAKYLRCSNTRCRHNTKQVKLDVVFAALQVAFAKQATQVAEALRRPTVDPPGVSVLQAEIKTLETISGTEVLIQQKRTEIAALRGESASSVPLWALEILLSHPYFWVKLSDERLNDALRLVVASVPVQLGEKTADAKVTEVVFRTPGQQRCPVAPGELIPLRFTREQARVAFDDQKLDEALAALGLAA